jgi:hypothetical protein
MVVVTKRARSKGQGARKLDWMPMTVYFCQTVKVGSFGKYLCAYTYHSLFFLVYFLSNFLRKIALRLFQVLSMRQDGCIK